MYPPEPVVSAKISKDLATNLAQQGFNVTVIAPQPSRPKAFNFSVISNKEDSADNVKLITLPSFVYPDSNPLGRLLESISFGWQSYKFIRANNPDKVYMNTWPIFGQFGVARACVTKKIPYVIHVQDLYPESLINKLPSIIKLGFKLVLMPFEKYTLRHAEKIIAISQNMKSYLEHTRDAVTGKVSVVYNWQDDDQFYDVPYQRLGNQKFTFTFLGNNGPVAGVEGLILAFQKANLKNCCLTIAGGGSKKQDCIDLANKTPELDIKFVDVPQNAVAKIQSEANVLLLPVIKGAALSSIPSKLPAYMLSAKPILATIDRESDTAKALVQANCGWLGNAEDIDWLAKCMAKVSSLDNVELKELGENGRNFCLKNFSKEINLKNLVKSVLND